MDSTAPLIDRSQAFLVYASFCGDIERTAHALELTPVQVLRVVDEENWTARLKPILELKKSGKPGDLERAMNRALNFVQAHRMRLIVERAIKHFTGMDEQTFSEMMANGTRFTKDGQPALLKMSTRAIADLASALEKAHAMTYQALGDTSQERMRANAPAQAGDSYADMHAQIAQAMAKAGQSTTPRALLLDAQLAHAQLAPKSPVDDSYDRDEH